jgi:hypothetical protein
MVPRWYRGHHADASRRTVVCPFALWRTSSAEMSTAHAAKYSSRTAGGSPSGLLDTEMGNPLSREINSLVASARDLSAAANRRTLRLFPAGCVTSQRPAADRRLR